MFIYTIVHSSIRKKPKQLSYSYSAPASAAKKIAHDLFEVSKNSTSITFTMKNDKGKEYSYVASKNADKISVRAKYRQIRRKNNDARRVKRVSKWSKYGGGAGSAGDYTFIDWVNTPDILDRLNWYEVCQHREIIDFLREHPERIDLFGLAANPNPLAFELLRDYRDEFAPDMFYEWNDEYGTPFVIRMAKSLSMAAHAEALDILYEIVIDNHYGIQGDKFDSLLSAVLLSHGSDFRKQEMSNAKIKFMLTILEKYYDKISSPTLMSVNNLLPRIENHHVKKLYMFLMEKKPDNTKIYDKILESPYMEHYIIDHWDDIIGHYDSPDKWIKVVITNPSDKVIDFILPKLPDNFSTIRSGYWYLFTNPNMKVLSIVVNDIDKGHITWTQLIEAKGAIGLPKQRCNHMRNIEYLQKFVKKFEEEVDFRSDFAPAGRRGPGPELIFKTYVAFVEMLIYEKAMIDDSILEVKVENFPLFYDRLPVYARMFPLYKLVDVMGALAFLGNTFWEKMAFDNRDSAIKIMEKYPSKIKWRFLAVYNTNKKAMNLLKDNVGKYDIADISSNAKIFKKLPKYKHTHMEGLKANIDQQKLDPYADIDYVVSQADLTGFNDAHTLKHNAAAAKPGVDTSSVIISEPKFRDIQDKLHLKDYIFDNKIPIVQSKKKSPTSAAKSSRPKAPHTSPTETSPPASTSPPKSK